jgi:hypothetical protein
MTALELAQWAAINNKKAYAARLAREAEKHTEGYLEQYGKAMGYKKGWSEFQKSLYLGVK